MKRRALLSLILAWSLCSGYAQKVGDARPWVFWYWMQGAVSEQGITADLQAMKENGIAGAYLMPIKGPASPPVYSPAAVQLGPQWWKMVKFAMKEADRFGLKLGMHVSDGFALAGGPWITPELSMQKVVWSKSELTGGHAAGKLTEPEAFAGYYRDIAVFAYRSPVGEGLSTRTVVPKITTSLPGVDASFLVKSGTKESLKSDKPCWIQYEFQQPFTCRTIATVVNGTTVQAQRLIIQVSDNGVDFHTVTHLEPPRHGWQDTDFGVTHSIEPVTSRWFRFVYDKAGSEPGAEDLDAAKWKPSLKIVNLQLSSEAAIHQFESKNGEIWRVSKPATDATLPAEVCVPKNEILDLTSHLRADGTLDWRAPAGKWTILRMGHTSTGHTNATGGGGIGLECDKFNPDAIRLQYDSWYGEAIRQVGPQLAKDVLRIFHVDSWECGSQNWSANFRDEFRKRRGYDPIPYLPAMAGVPVTNAETSEGFLYDVRLTIAELVNDKFYTTLAACAKKNGVTFTAESVAPTMVSDGMLHYKSVDVPMGEFWLNSPTHDKLNDMLDAISAAHIYGKPVIQAEAFTTVRMAWNEHPGMMKALQDRNYALGVNKLVYHVFVHNPWLDRKPGMTLDGVGLYFQRDQTWWKPGKAWVDYAVRSQRLLQQGSPVVDVAVFTGEEVPRRSVLPDRLVPVLPGIFGDKVVNDEKKRLANFGEPMRQIPAGVTNSANMFDADDWVNPLRGYAYDSVNPDALAGAKVVNKKIVLLSGATYRVLVIPGRTKLDPANRMSVATAEKLLELVRGGAIVIAGDKPLTATGLPVKHDQFDAVTNRLWSPTGGLLRAPFVNADFSAVGVPRDLDAGDTPAIAWTHRATATKDIYFISNQIDSARTVTFTFRVKDKIPQLYDAVSNTTITNTSWTTGTDGRVRVTLRLEPNASTFVIFTPSTRHEPDGHGRNWTNFNTVTTLNAPWSVKFDEKLGGPAAAVRFASLTDWTASADSAIRYYSGTAVYKTKFMVDAARDFYLDLGSIANIAEIYVNGIPCGTVWTPPYRVSIQKALKPGENELTIAVTNTWANRLTGDQRIPPERRVTATNAPYRLDGKTLQPAGLLGPVTICQPIRY